MIVQLLPLSGGMLTKFFQSSLDLGVKARPIYQKYSCSHPKVAVTFFTFYQNIYKHLSLLHPSPVKRATKVFYNLKLPGVRDKTVGYIMLFPK
jgi:hypothetical protein